MHVAMAAQGDYWTDCKASPYMALMCHDHVMPHNPGDASAM
ncbi:MAG: hypothetical protein SWH68_16575 [Thermodesulfobacteriota bacterium]|nr:hypothetical protein [Thermodesulfobacteriota bacterium]